MKIFLLAFIMLPFLSISQVSQDSLVIQFHPQDSTYIIDKSTMQRLVYFAQKGLFTDALSIEINELQKQLNSQSEDIYELSNQMDIFKIYTDEQIAKNDFIKADIDKYKVKIASSHKWNWVFGILSVILTGGIILH